MVAAFLLHVGVVLVVLSFYQPTTAPSQPPLPLSGGSTAPQTPSPAAHTTSPQPARLPPLHLDIPAIGVSKNLLRVGLNPDRSVQVPSSAQADFPAWYRLGTVPGQQGSAVILGHVDSVRGPAVFYRLSTLHKGDQVQVTLSGGEVAHFVVQRTVTYPDAEFPARKVYGPHGYPALQLVTCGGAYDQNTGYQANVVVYTRLASTTPA